MISNVGHYFDKNLITSRSTKYVLEAKLENIRGEMILLDIFQSSWMPKWAKDRVAENLKRQINHEIDDLIFQIKNQKNFSQTILAEAKDLLVEDLNFIKE